MQALPVASNNELKAAEILHEARIYAQLIQSIQQPGLGHLKTTWDDYETYKGKLSSLNLEPDQYALCCGMLAEVLGL